MEIRVTDFVYSMGFVNGHIFGGNFAILPSSIYDAHYMEIYTNMPEVQDIGQAFQGVPTVKGVTVRFQGLTDAPLVNFGKKQAVARWLVRIEIEEHTYNATCGAIREIANRYLEKASR